MNKSDAIEYLRVRKILTAPVASAQNAVEEAQKRIEWAHKKYKVTIIVLLVFLVIMFIGHDPDDTYTTFWYLVFGGTPLGLIFWRSIHWVAPAQAAYDEAVQRLHQEQNDETYLAGRQGFPANFYNYADVYRLWRLMSENRADTLKEAYNLLETQHYYEDQLSIQEEIRSLQADTAASAQAAAVAASAAAVGTAFNRR